MHYLELVDVKNYINLSEIFVLRQKIKQNASGLNRGLSLNFWQLKRAHYMIFMEECGKYSEKEACYCKRKCLQIDYIV